MDNLAEQTDLPKNKSEQSAQEALLGEFFNANKEFFGKLSVLSDRALALGNDPAASVGKHGGYVLLKDAEAALSSKFESKTLEDQDGRARGKQYFDKSGILRAALRADFDITVLSKFDGQGRSLLERTSFDNGGKRIISSSYDKDARETQRVAFHKDGQTPRIVSKFPLKSDLSSRFTQDIYRSDGSREMHSVSYKNLSKIQVESRFGPDGLRKKQEKTYHPDGEENQTYRYDEAGNLTELEVNEMHMTVWRPDGTRAKDIIPLKDGSIETSYSDDGETINSKVWYRADGTAECRLERGHLPEQIIEYKYQQDGKTLAEKGYYQDDFSSVVSKFNSKGVIIEERVTRADGSGSLTNYSQDGMKQRGRSHFQAGEMRSKPAF
ncbi:MAG: hypothetical protein K2X27_21925 [Candidatus Obscuribacterales bacterium]|nr:hypothetical protein [Candidatus Obscuribacterales bacterium]